MTPHQVPLDLSLFCRYLISDFEGGSLLRIEPVSIILFGSDQIQKNPGWLKVGFQVRKKKEAGAYECVAENGNGDPVSATADLTVYEGALYHFNYQDSLGPIFSR